MRTGGRATHGRVYTYLSICPFVRLSFFYSILQTKISGHFRTDSVSFWPLPPPGVGNPVLPLRFQIDAETPRAVAADHVNVFFIQELRERLGGNAVPFVFVFGIPLAYLFAQLGNQIRMLACDIALFKLILFHVI